MGAGRVDVRQTRTFSTENYLVKQVPIAIGLILFSLLVMALASDSSDAGDKPYLIGWMLIALSLGYIGYAFHRRARPKKPLIELSPDGILYRIFGDKEFRIPWSEVKSLGLADINLRRGASIRDVTVANVSQGFFEATVPIRSWWKRGPGWRYVFIPNGDTVQIAFHHDVLSVPADELWNEIETRWRAFSGHPNIPLLATPRVPRSRKWFGGWTLSPAVRRVGAAAAALLAVPAIYVWHWPVVWFSLPDVPPGSATAYLQEMLDRNGVQARLAGRSVSVLRRSDVAGTGLARCVADIARDPDRGGSLLPYFAGRTLCTVPLFTTGGVAAVAIFELVIHTTQSPDWEGKLQAYRSLATTTLDENEVDAALCRLGSCATSDL